MKAASKKLLAEGVRTMMAEKAMFAHPGDGIRRAIVATPGVVRAFPRWLGGTDYQFVVRTIDKKEYFFPWEEARKVFLALQEALREGELLAVADRFLRRKATIGELRQAVKAAKGE